MDRTNRVRVTRKQALEFNELLDGIGTLELAIDDRRRDMTKRMAALCPIKEGEIVTIVDGPRSGELFKVSEASPAYARTHGYIEFYLRGFKRLRNGEWSLVSASIARHSQVRVVDDFTEAA